MRAGRRIFVAIRLTRDSKANKAQQKADLEPIFAGIQTQLEISDYVAGWFMKAADYAQRYECSLRIRGHKFDLPRASRFQFCGR